MVVLDGLVKRLLPNVKEEIIFTITNTSKNFYSVEWKNSGLYITADSPVSAAHGLYDYLKKVCRINYSWCGNEEIKIDKLTPFQGVISSTIRQKHRVYMNYCTLGYSMSWWDFSRWEKELDFMALNGINMPLCPIGSEMVWFETMIEFGMSEKDALASITGIPFYPWHLMTNIDSYYPPTSKKYLEERLTLGKKILERALQYGMTPIQQGFSGHIPVKFIELYPCAKIILKKEWCEFPKTAQLDPLDPLFLKIGNTWLNKQAELLGAYGYYACDPFHENSPPKKGHFYLKSVGKIINKIYYDFDNKSIWVMQSWSMRKPIAKAVPKNRLLILDINSQKSKTFTMPRGYNVVAGMLHDFGGKNAMQGKLKHHAENTYVSLSRSKSNIVGSGMFMEGIEQNPIVYELQFDLLTRPICISLTGWLYDYIDRRYSPKDHYTKESLVKVWKMLFETCYKDSGYHENGVGSQICARPSFRYRFGSPCDNTRVFYNKSRFIEALKLFISLADKLYLSDGYQFDLYDMTRQALSNRFDTLIEECHTAYLKKDSTAFKHHSEFALNLLLDLDNFLSLRKNYNLARWINDAHNLASSKEEKVYFDEMARTLITLWGDVNTSCALSDYSWREWSGLIKEYYLPRWKKYFDYVLKCLETNTKIIDTSKTICFNKATWKGTPFYEQLAEFELKWTKTYSEPPLPNNKNVCKMAQQLIEKYLS